MHCMKHKTNTESPQATLLTRATIFNFNPNSQIASPQLLGLQFILQCYTSATPPPQVSVLEPSYSEFFHHLRMKRGNHLTEQILKPFTRDVYTSLPLPKDALCQTLLELPLWICKYIFFKRQRHRQTCAYLLYTKFQSRRLYFAIKR